MNHEIVLQRIDGLLNPPDDNTRPDFEEIYCGTLSILQILYGENSTMQSSFLKSAEQIRKTCGLNVMSLSRQIFHLSLGALTSAKKDVEFGLLVNIKKKAAAEVYADFIAMAKSAIENGYKDVSAVMSAAALEDSLKKYATLNGLNVDDKDMSEVINALSSASLLGGPQLKIVRSHLTLRNKAMHAEWSQIDTPEVKSLIAFTEEFVLRNLDG